KEPVYLVDAEGYYETVTTGTKSFLGTLGVARDITERVLAREALRKSEERFRNIYNTSPLAFVIWDLDCRVTDWNEHAEKIFGWSKEDIVSQNFFEYIIPNSAELKVKDVVDSLIHGKQTHSVNENLTKSGKTILCEWYNSLLYDSSGDVIGVISLALDVTEVKKAENDLIQSRENLSVTLSSIGDGVIATDVKGCVTFMNPISEALSGWKQEDAKGKKIQKIFNIKNSKTGKKAENPVERVLKEGVIVGLANHTELKSKDGNRYQIADSAAPIMKEDGEVMGCVLVFRDVTEEYKQGEKLIESEKKYRNLFESSNDANFILHPERGYIDCNRAALTMFGAKSKEEFYSMNPIDISPEYQSDGSMSSEKARQMIDTTFEKGSNFFEWTHKRFNGEEFPCTVHATQVKYGDEFIMHGTIRDITVQRKAEKEILESRQILSDVLNTIPVRVFWKDKNNVYLGCNQLFANDAGRTSPEDIIGDDDFNMGWAEQAELYRSDDKQVMTSGQAKINYEEPQTTPDGEQIWLRTSKIPLLDSKDKIYGILGTYEDITERKKSENIKKVLNNILKSSVETDNLNELLKVVHMELSVLMDAKNFFVALYDKDSDYYTYPYHFDETEKWDISKPEKIEGGLTDYVRKNCKALLLNKQKFQEMLDAGNGVLLGTKPES
ncbi:MAG: PAS domain S-box protein, partial [bacterium]|nr:PAS domain S-box protein [bacterium]